MKNNRQKKLRVLLIIKEPIGGRMNAIGIRYFEFAKFLSTKYRITLIAPRSSGDMGKFGFSYMPYTLKSCIRSIYNSDLLIGMNPHPLIILVAGLLKKKIILDLYDPTLIENLERIDGLPLKEKMCLNTMFAYWIKLQIQQAYHYLYANERQKDLWLGVLALLGKLNPANYSHDKEVNKLVSKVPTGIPDQFPVKSVDVLRDVLPGISRTDKILLWVGAPSSFFDFETLIYAMQDISQRRNDIKLVVISGNPDYSETLRKNKQIADSLGLTDKAIYFIKEWVPYKNMADYYLESDLGISLHYNNLETRFSMRNRTLGYLWGQLPVIATKGDFLANLIEENNWGIVIEERNRQQLVASIIELLDDRKAYQNCKTAIERDIPAYRWSTILEKLDNAVALVEKAEFKGGVFKILNLITGIMILTFRFFFYRIRYGSVKDRIEQSSLFGESKLSEC